MAELIPDNSLLTDQQLCEKIYALDKRILLVGVFQEDRLLAGGPATARRFLIPDKEKLPMLRFQLHLVKTMIKGWEEYFGFPETITVRFKKAVLCALAWKDKWVHVVAEPSLTAQTIRKRVSPLLR